MGRFSGRGQSLKQSLYAAKACLAAFHKPASAAKPFSLHERLFVQQLVP